jgi:DivIVA domain-containing protein
MTPSKDNGFPTQRGSRLRHLSPEEIRGYRLRMAAIGRRGYRRNDVDLLLARVAVEVAERDEAIRELRAELARLHEQYRGPAPMPPQPGGQPSAQPGGQRPPQPVAPMPPQVGGPVPAYPGDPVPAPRAAATVARARATVYRSANRQPGRPLGDDTVVRRARRDGYR